MIGEADEAIEDMPESPQAAAGRKGGQARAKSLTPARRSEIAAAAAEARWAAAE